MQFYLPRAQNGSCCVLAVLIVLLGIQPSWLISRSEATIATLEPTRLVKRWLLIRRYPSSNLTKFVNM